MTFNLHHKHQNTYLTFYYQYLPRIMEYQDLKNKSLDLKEKTMADKEGKSICTN